MITFIEERKVMVGKANIRVEKNDRKMIEST